MSEPTRAPIDTTYETAKLRVDALNDRAREHWRSDSRNALALCEEASTLAMSLDYRLGLARSRNIRSRCHLRLANPEAARNDASEALAQFEALGDEEGTEDALTTLGLIELNLGHFTEALGYFLASYGLCRGRGDKREAVALGNLGVIYDYLGDYATSLDLHLRSWSVSKGCNNVLGEKVSLNNVGYMHYRLGQFDEALTHYFRALSFEGVGDPNLHALLLDNIGLAYEKLEDYASALSYQQKSLTIREALDDRWGVAASLDGLGSVYTALGETTEAQGRLERSLALKEEVGDRKGQAETCVLLGTLFTREGQVERALYYLHRACETAEALTSREDSFKAHRALAEAYKLGGRFREALGHYETYHDLRDGLLSEVSNQKVHTLRVRFETEQAERERELYRLKNVELAGVVADLEASSRSLQKANEQKTVLMAQLEKQAREDPLTGLANRRYFSERLAHELGRARRFGSSLSVALCDIDDFKGVNDTFSHGLGDEVLRAVAKLLDENSRAVDTVSRYGGEEFVMLLPETSAPAAAVACEKVRRAVETFPWSALHPGLVVTLSVGVADDATVADFEALIALADAKLYEAKRNGKNQVRV